MIQDRQAWFEKEVKGRFLSEIFGWEKSVRIRQVFQHTSAIIYSITTETPSIVANVRGAFCDRTYLGEIIFLDNEIGESSKMTPRSMSLANELRLWPKAKNIDHHFYSNEDFQSLNNGITM